MFITVTGADERTSISDLVGLTKVYPRVEVAFLYTASAEGRNRYPSLSWIKRSVAALSGRCAVHLCGRESRKQLLDGDLIDLMQHVRRIQVNGPVYVEELWQLSKKVPTLITQHTLANFPLAGSMIANHVLLVDGSGGRGVSPEHWKRPESERQAGFAGGIGPDNLEIEVEKISRVATGNWWIAMEHKVRTNDWFDAEKAWDVVHRFHEIQVEEPHE